MGKNKTFFKTLTKIQDQIVYFSTLTFRTRSHGLLKKAAEISKICNIKLFLAYSDKLGNIYEFKTPDIDNLQNFLDPIFGFQDVNYYPSFYKKENEPKTAVGLNFQQKIENIQEDNITKNLKKKIQQQINENFKIEKEKKNIEQKAENIEENEKENSIPKEQLPVSELVNLLEQKLQKKQQIEQEYDIISSLLNKKDNNNELTKEDKDNPTAYSQFIQQYSANPSLIKEFIEFQKMYLEQKNQEESNSNELDMMKESLPHFSNLQQPGAQMQIPMLQNYESDARFMMPNQMQGLQPIGQIGQLPLQSPHIYHNLYQTLQQQKNLENS